MKKRWLALALALAMCLTWVPAAEAELVTLRLPDYTGKGSLILDDGADYALLPAVKDYRAFRGYQNDAGELELDLRDRYDGGRLFHQGLAAVYRESYGALRYGYIDRTGTEVIPMEFNYASDFSEGYATVATGLEWTDTVIDRTGTVVFTLPECDVGNFFEGLARFRDKSGKFGFVDSDGQVVIEAKYAVVGNFCEGRAWFQDGAGLYGYLDADGNEIVSARYLTAGNFKDGAAVVSTRDGYFVLDKAGAVKTDLACAWASGPWADGVVLVGRDVGGSLRYGAVDTAGQVVLDVKYTACLEYCEGRFVVAGDQGFGLVDRTGRELTRIVYEDAVALPGGRVLLTTDDLGYTGWFTRLGGALLPQEAPDTMAYASETRVLLDGVETTFQMFALREQNGGETNYVRLRDVAWALRNTQAGFEILWENGVTTVVPGGAYTAIGGEMTAPELDDMGYERPQEGFWLNGRQVTPEGLLFHDEEGGGYTYYKLRDLGEAIGFNVRWDGDAGVIRVETDRPYTG